MSPSKGWFESDDDYRSRVAQEADERTIEDSTGSAPSKGWFENDDDYRDRITREADEHKIEDSTGSAPSKGWFENDDDYRDRIHRESNERTIEDSTGSAPSKGWFESDDDYDTRIRKESNEQILLDGTGSAPKKGWFEGDHDYRSRIAHEAREVRVTERSSSSTGSNSDSSSSYDTVSGYSQSISSTGSHTSLPVTTGGLLPVIIVGVLVLIGLALFQSPSMVKQPPSVSSPTKQSPDPINPAVAVVFPMEPDSARDVWVTSYYDYGDNFGVNDHKLQVGGWGDWYYSLLECRLDGHPKNVKRVLLELYSYPRGDKSLPTEMYLDRLLAPWDEEASWKSQPDAVTFALLPAPIHTNDWYRVDITELYRGWITGTYPNYGVRLRPLYNNNRFNVFYSTGYSQNPALRPRLVIEPG